MPQKGIYVREEDEEVFAKAEAVGGRESMSQIVVKALTEWVERHANEGGYEEFDIEPFEAEWDGFDDSGWAMRSVATGRHVKFLGRLLAKMDDTSEAEEVLDYFEASQLRSWLVYATKGERFVVVASTFLEVHLDVPESGGPLEPFSDKLVRREVFVYESLAEAHEKCGCPQALLHVAEGALDGSDALWVE